MTTNAATTLEPPKIAAKPVVDASPWWRRHIWTVVFIGLLASALAAYLFRPEMPDPRIARVFQLTNDGAAKNWLNWGGSKLFFVMFREGKNRIFQIPEDGGTPLDLSHFSPDNATYFYIWDASRDGKITQFGRPMKTSGGPGVYRARVPDGKLQMVADLGGIKYGGNLSGWRGMTPDGDPLILKSRDSKEIYAFHLEY